MTQGHSAGHGAGHGADHVVNTTQAEVWNGHDGLHWADHHDRYDTMAEGGNRHLFEAAALTETSRVLDIGCGTGATTRLAARRAPHGHAVGIDLSAPMLDRARRLATEHGVANTTFVQGDAQVHPFPSAHFQVAISRAGVMFFADPVVAFANIRGALAPGGRLVFLTHNRVSTEFQAVYAAIAEHVPPTDPPGSGSAVASFADPDHVRAVLTDAGYRHVTATPVEILSVLGTDATDATDFLFSGALRPVIGQADEASVDRARAAVRDILRASTDAGGVRLPAHAWIYRASVG